MEQHDIIERLKNIVAYKLDINIKPNDIDAESSLLEGGLGLDSISIVNLIVLIEKEFDLEFEDEEIGLRLFETLKTLADFIQNKQKATSADQ